MDDLKQYEKSSSRVEPVLPREYMDIPIIVSSAIPENEIRFVDMNAVRENIAILDGPLPITFKNEIVGDSVRVTVSMPLPRFINRKTGEILGA